MKNLFNKLLYFFRLTGTKHTQKVVNLHTAEQQLDSLKEQPKSTLESNLLPLPFNTHSLNQRTLAPKPSTPHYRRIQTVYAVLDTAPPNLTYNQLIDYVREMTGQGCSRKLISKWKKAPKLTLTTTTTLPKLPQTA